MDLEKLSRHEKVDLITDMRSLQANKGWIHLTRMLQEEVEDVVSKIIDVEAERPQADEKILKWRRFYLDYLINLPQHVINGVTEADMPENAIMDADPYQRDTIKTNF